MTTTISRNRRLATLLKGGMVLAMGAGLVTTIAAADLDPTTGKESPAAETSTSTAPSEAPASFRSPEDGALDVSGFLDKAYGFLPLLVPITEPAVGYGAAGGAMFIDKPAGEARAGFGRPNISVVGGLATENGTQGLLLGDLRHWLGDRLQTLVGVVHASVNLDFFGIGEESALESHPLSYHLRPTGGMVRTKYRFGESRVWAGLNYALADTEVEFDAPSSTPGLPDFQTDSRVGGLTPSITFDSRDNMFTSNRGTYFEGSAGFFSPTLGGDDTFQRVSLTLMQFQPLNPRVTLGVRGGATFSFGEVPFYLRPYVTLRGAPILRYQGEESAEVETEVRWQLYKRYSVVGFAGYGVAWNGFANADNSNSVVTGGTGFRYELARRYGIHAGLDVAFGPDQTAIYFQVGSAWVRP